jgi:hypothetical protein
MVSENVRYINEEPPGTEYARECLDLLRDLSAKQLAQLKGILLKASLNSQGDYFTGGYFEGIRTVSVPIKELEGIFNVEGLDLLDSYIYGGKGSEEEGNYAFFLPIGLILESVLPNELEVMNDRGYSINQDEAFIDFKVLQV